MNTRSIRLIGTNCIVGAGLILSSVFANAFAAGPCDPGSNPIVCENSKPGTPSSEWDIGGNGDLSIQGFATRMSVNAGESIGFKVDTDASEYSLLIYRMGWYGGDGARLVDTLSPTAALPQIQPECLTDAETHLMDCGNWGLSATWDVPQNAVSGVYIARLRRPDTGGDSHIVFVVRDDSSTADVLFQTSDSTWQAYNNYEDRSLYMGGPNGRAYKVSYNRPMFARGGTPDGRDSFFGSEYAMVRWLERNGYDVTYFSSIDSDRADPALFLNHDIFLSVGHDEYWSAQQRANVEAARDAGVNLVFASGNEVYWKTRWEPSIDGSNTDYRTLVSYKETRNGAKIDPSPEWTGTWRDPRFSPPSDGGRPENELTGTFFTVNCCTYSLRVPAEFGNLRFWRNTSVATLAPGTEAVFPLGTLGYEWDEDLDNGFRPPGVFRMSRTTETVPERLIDYGQTTAVEDATHHLMMYRASSGALVFGAGTVQWSWGLDSYHDGLEAPVDPDMQQATVNVFGDMGVQPQTLDSGMIAASASTDTIKPQVTISAPDFGVTLLHGEVVTVAGTATDANGVVAAVEVSLDGGSSWHPASGRESWSYSGSPLARGQQTFMARAVDDSGNLGSAVSIEVDVSCPCTLFGSDQLPRVDSYASSTSNELGMKFQSDIDGYIAGVRYYKGPTNSGTHTGSLWSTSGVRLATGTFVNETSTGWQELTFAQPVAISAGTSYIASYFAPGGYTAQLDRFASQATISPPLRALARTETEPNGVFSSSGVSTFPNQGVGSTNYWVDVVFSDVTLPDTNPPSILATTPIDGTSSVSVNAIPTLVVDEDIDTESMELEITDSDSSVVAGTISFDQASLTVSFTPSSQFDYSQLYTVTASFTDTTGNSMAQPVIFTFETSQPDGAVAALWNDSEVPAIVDSNDTGSIEVGTKFIASQDLDITGVRFYKALNNTGPHVGSLWDASGTLLNQVTFGNESSSGWQQASFSSPARITAGQTYVISYYSPNGHYSATTGYFEQAFSNGPLTAPASASAGGNGVYAYGNGGFPTSSGNRTNYWVSPVYQRLPDTQAPQLTSTYPIDGASSVDTSSILSAVLDEPVESESLSMIVYDDTGATVAGSFSYDDSTSSVSFQPSAPLNSATLYSVEIVASDLLGNTTSSPLGFSFESSLADGAVAALWDDAVVPDITDSNDTGSIELGTKFTADQALDITGVRFYKSLANTGPHAGSLWDASGALLAQVTFDSVSSMGWQQALFSNPIRINASQTYVISYSAPNGHYAVTSEYFDQAHSNGPLTAPASDSAGGNGVYVYGAGGFPSSSFNRANYWVSPVYEYVPDTQPPVLLSTTPAAGESSVNQSVVITATFDEPVNAASIIAVLSDSSGSAIGGSVSYDAALKTMSFTPAATLESETTYQMEILVSDIVDNTTPSPLAFSFKTSLPDGAVSALWNDSEVPFVIDTGDTSPIEVGTKFIATQDLAITGIRFYKSVTNTGTHIGSLWDNAGTLLAQATFINETSAGWQEVAFDESVLIEEGVQYVASYHAPNGHYSMTGSYFETAHVSGPLTAPASVSSGGNGVYAYGSGEFPTVSFNASNYWVTPAFEPLPDLEPPQLLTVTPLDDASSVAVNTQLTAVFDEPIDVGSLSMVVSDDSGTLISGSVLYDAPSLTATFVPGELLETDTAYTVEILATDMSGNSNASPLLFSFRTSLADGSVAALWDDSVVPGMIDSGDTGSIEVGTKFITDRAVEIIGVRFFKSPENLGPHTGSLWSESGTLLSQVTFGSESTTGWQEALFPTPIQINAGQTYVVSYLAPSGHYSATSGYFNQSHSSGPLTAPADSAVGGNGVYSYGAGSFPSSSANQTNYWVSAIYQEIQDQIPPELTDTSPASGATSVAPDTDVLLAFDEPLSPSSIAFAMKDENDVQVAGVLTYDETLQAIVFQPSASLSSGTTYTVVATASDTAGNVTSSPLSMTFRTALPDGDILALWDDSIIPDTLDSADVGSVEVGLKFIANQNLDITGVRFYKSVANTGTHIGSLWDGEGTLLAQGTFENESTAGWQQLTFSSPVRIIAAQRYVVSYLAPEGHYSVSSGYFDQAYANGPLTALASTAQDGNGIYSYGDGGFPTSSYNNSNYWVSPVYAIPLPPSGSGEGLWDYSAVPDVIDAGDPNAIELGVRFLVTENVNITGLRFYKSAANTGPHVGSLWNNSGSLLAQATFENESSSGWQEVQFPNPISIVAGETYVASYFAPNGHYSANGAYFQDDYSSALLTAPGSTANNGNGVYAYGNGGFPASSYNKTNYWITPLYELP